MTERRQHPLDGRPYRFPAHDAGMVRAMDTWNLRNLDVEPHQPSVLRSDRGAARCIAINLPAGDQLQDHEVHEHAWLHVHDGEVEVVQDGQSTTGAAGFLAHFEPHERHEVRATADSTLILFLAPWPGEGRDEDFDA
jgi:quercetin dioxygenase-like cupin family protein